MRHLFAFLVLTFALCISASADPVTRTITSGSVTLPTGSYGAVDFTGNGFSVQGMYNPTEGAPPQFLEDEGGHTSFGYYVSGGSSFYDLLIKMDGIDYLSDGDPEAQVNLQFFVVAPYVKGASQLIGTFSFEFNRFDIGFHGEGSGTAIIDVVPDDNVADFGGATLRFGQAPTPTPEPATICLVVTGLGAGFGFRKRLVKR